MRITRQALRHNEYYATQNKLDWLYMRSMRGDNFRRLYTLIIHQDNILLAYRNIKSNTGRNTSGTDNRTIKYLSNMSSEQLFTLVVRKLENYQPQKVKRVLIPKPNGEKRPLGIPTITDRLIQQCILQIIEPICEAKFVKHSYGFRPLRNCRHAIARSYFLAQQANLHWVVDVDIKGFFDNIDHKKLLKQIWTLGIRDKKLLSIIQKILKSEIEGEGIPTKGTPQGGIISPLLANIALNEFDHWIESQWEKLPLKYKYAGDQYRLNVMRTKTNLKEVYIVRYADDFKLFCRNRSDAIKYFEAIKLWLQDRLKLEVSNEKSKIVNLKRNYSEFLGIKFKVRVKGKAYGKDKWVIKSHISDKAKSKITKETRKHIKDMQYNGYKAVNRYNQYIFGVHLYYNMATHVTKDFDEIFYSVLRKIHTRLKRLRRINKQDKLPQYISKYYGKSLQLRYLYDTPIIPVGYVQHKISSFQYRGYSPYVAEDRHKVHKELEIVSQFEIKRLMETRSNSRSVEYNDNRISLFISQNGKCAITKMRLDIDEIYCHHKIPISHNGSDSYSNLIIISRDVHGLVHATSKVNIIAKLDKMNLSSKQTQKVNQLRSLVGKPNIGAYL